MLLHIVWQIAVIGRECKEMLPVIVADPEHKTTVGHSGAVDEQTVGEHWRDQHDIAITGRIDAAADLHTYVTFQKKIKFIVGVRVHVYCGKVVVVIIIKFKILRQHILPLAEDRL